MSSPRHHVLTQPLFGLRRWARRLVVAGLAVGLVGAEHADVAAVSFIRTPADVDRVLEVIGGIADDHELSGRDDLSGVMAAMMTMAWFARPRLGLRVARGATALPRW